MQVIIRSFTAPLISKSINVEEEGYILLKVSVKLNGDDSFVKCNYLNPKVINESVI